MCKKFLWSVIVLCFARVSFGAADLTKPLEHIDRKDFASAEHLLTDILSHTPSDQAAQFLLARTLAWQGKFGPSIHHYNTLLDQSPNNADYLYGKALVLHWQGENSSAIAMLRQARQFAPNYADIWVSELKILRSFNDEHHNHEAAQLYDQIKQKFPEINIEKYRYIAKSKVNSSVKPKEIKEKKSTSLEFSYQTETLSNQAPDWQAQYLNITQPLGNKTFYSQLQSIKRYDLPDHQAVIGLALPVGTRWNMDMSMGFSMESNFLPKIITALQLQYQSKMEINWYYGVRHNRYQHFNTLLNSVTVEKYWGSFRSTYTLFASLIDSQFVNYSHSIQSYYHYRNNSFAGLIFSFGKELEYDGQHDPITFKIKSYQLRGRHHVLGNWSAIYALSHHQQGSAYDRNGINIGVHYQF